MLRKSGDSEITRPDYSNAAADKEYESLVFNPELFATAVTAVNGKPIARTERPPSPIGEPLPTIAELKERKFQFLIMVINFEEIHSCILS